MDPHPAIDSTSLDPSDFKKHVDVRNTSDKMNNIKSYHVPKQSFLQNSK